MSSRLQFTDSAKSQILSIIFLKEFIKLNVNLDMVIKNVKLGELDINIATVFFFFFLNKNFEVDLIEYKLLFCDKNYQKKFDEKLKERFFNT